MQIRPVEKFVYDVFLGQGYDQWVRVRKFHWGCKILNGNCKLDREQSKEIFHNIESHPAGSLMDV